MQANTENTSIIFTALTEDSLRKLVEQSCEKVVTNVISRKNIEDLNGKLLSPAETCKIFQPAISKVTLAAWTNAGHLTRYDLGGRVYYRYSEVIEAAKHLKRYKRLESTPAA